MKKICLIATGGTIASSQGEAGLEPKHSVENLLSYTPEIKTLCELNTVQLFSIDSTNMQPEYWIDIVKYIEQHYDLFDGFVITHGTDAMAYTSSAISYMIQNLTKPIVLTGSQKPMEAEETDAKRNLIDAVRFACENIGGVFVVFNGKAMNGNRAVKLRTKSYDAFESINYPIIATIQDTISYHVDMHNESKEKPNFYPSLCNDVLLLKIVPGTKPEIFDYIKEHYKALVIESFGNGGLPFDPKRNLLMKIKELIDMGIIVVVTTQCLLEGSNLKLYDVGQKALKIPVLPAHDMTSEAAIVKLMWALGQSDDFEQVKKIFLTPIHNDVIPS